MPIPSRDSAARGGGGRRHARARSAIAAVVGVMVASTAVAISADRSATAADTGVTLTAISPSSSLGGVPVKISGTGFDTAGTTMVDFNGVPAPQVSCSRSTTCVVVTPPGTGTVDVSVTVGAVTSVPITFTYVPGPPRIGAVSPTCGPGGTTVLITGTDFSLSSTSVTFGSTPLPPGSFNVASETTILVHGAPA
ncbi:MAG: IPT/TIG domain-containing protein, partial [Actinomycetota bacterium]|nr:IPT/TIG domain-containing protein [Actinomycetota bacterium]